MKKEFSVRILQRDFQNPLTLPPIKMIPEWYSYSAIGGPKQAEIEVKTSEDRALWELLEYLRCPVEINDDRETLVWWGYVNRIEITIDAVTVSVNLDEMFNRVSVIYSDADGKGKTSWIQENDSVSVYGTKEIIYTTSIEGWDYAAAYAAIKLAEHKKPVPNPDIADPAEPSARLSCKGWFETLDWKYYGNIAGRESYEETASESQEIGRISGNQKAAQSFQLASSSGWLADRIQVRVRKEENPIDNLILSLCSDNSGVPGSVLVSESLSAAEIPESFDWINFELTTSVNLAAGATYWIVLERSGAVDSSNYYLCNVNEELGYLRGVFRIYNGSWAARDPDADLLFIVIGESETTKQIQDIVSSCGQFISGVDLKVTSGITTSQYREGENSAKYELMELLKAGESSGQRLLATVTKDRELVVDKEPELDTYKIGLYLKSDGSLENEWNDPAYDRKCPVAVWARLKDVIPGSLDLGLLADPTIFFVEEAEYNVKKRRYYPTGKSTKSAFSVGTLIMDG